MLHQPELPRTPAACVALGSTSGTDVCAAQLRSRARRWRRTSNAASSATSLADELATDSVATAHIGDERATHVASTAQATRMATNTSGIAGWTHVMSAVRQAGTYCSRLARFGRNGTCREWSSGRVGKRRTRHAARVRCVKMGPASSTFERVPPLRVCFVFVCYLSALSLDVRGSTGDCACFHAGALP